ncbi:MAG: hypothetical protein A2487_08940, partial [Candidatus Raymondbacteria bacterium RifOxyC12_full_50_8]
MGPITALQSLINGAGLKARMARGGLWMGGGNGVEHALRFVRNMVLTRILAPEALGLMAIISSVTAALEAFAELGIREAIVQNPAGDKDTYLNSAWFLSLIRAVGLLAVGMAISPYVITFYHIEYPVILVRIALLGILFNGLISARAYVALKKMDYKKWVFIYQGGGIIGTLTTIVLVFFIRNVWALVIGFVVEAAMRCLISYILCPYLPRLSFNAEHTKALKTFSLGMLGLPVFYFIFMQTDIFVLGRLCSKAELGVYSMAAVLAQAPALLISVFINPIMMPVFSEINGQYDRINRMLFQITRGLCYACFPALVFCALYAKDILSLVYGAPYGVVALPFALIFMSTILRTCSAPLTTLYFASGRPRLQRRFVIIRAALMVALIYPLTVALGLAGAAL